MAVMLTSLKGDFGAVAQTHRAFENDDGGTTLRGG